MKPTRSGLPFALLALVGCASQNPPLYAWGSYEDQLHAYFKGESPEKLIHEMEKQAEVAHSKGQALPPGFQASLGLFYSKAGRDDKLAEHLSLEKQKFPESTGFIDGLFKRNTP